MEEKGREVGVAGNAAPVENRLPEVVAVEGPRRRAGATKRKAAANTSGATPSKRLAKEKLNPAHLASLHNGPCTRARQSPNKLAVAAAFPQNPADPLPPPLTLAYGEPVGAGRDFIPTEDDRQVPEPVTDADFEAVRSRDANIHVVPTLAGWFSWTKIHPLEERALPSFFNGKSEERTPDIYMEIRNAIMKKFHMDPQTQIERKDLSELSVGDSEARQEVMEFLDHWGLINFHPFPPPDSATNATYVDGAAKTASLVEKLYSFEMVQSFPRVNVNPKAAFSAPAMPPRLVPESAIADDLVKPEGPSVEYHCNSCSADCSRKRYHCQKQADFDLCSECYNDGKFGSGMTPADFILMESAEVPSVSGGSWTDQETLLLLEALELYGENWNEIAEHVATKTKAQCILHFVQMPIEDPFFEDKDKVDAGLPGNLDKNPIKNDSSPIEVTAQTVEVINAANVKNDSSPMEVTAQTVEVINAANEEPHVPSPVVTSKPNDAVVEVVPETDSNLALDALKSAFQAVGILPNPGESLSFAESGNPVMALAAFLAGLVEPDVVVASTRSSLKAMSEDSPNIQLAARHCFLLEDPPSDRKDPPACESADIDMLAGEAVKEENQTSILKDGDVSIDGTDKNEENAVPMEMESIVALEEIAPEVEEKVAPEEKDHQQECMEKSHVAESGDSALLEKVTPNTVKESESGELALEGEAKPSVVEESNDTASTMEVPPCIVKQSGDLASLGEVTPSTLKELGDLASQGEDKQCLEVTKASLGEDKQCLEVTKASLGEDKQCLEVTKASQGEDKQCSEATKAVDMLSDSVPSEEKGPQHTVGSNSTIGTAEDIGENDAKSKSEKSCNPVESRDDYNIDKIKRAAITALSAAAVKAKLLANQEEDQIRQLASLLIEKQLHKLETKFSFFTEMESVLLRTREQLDRARQRLYNERAQIVAARYGFPGSSSIRPMPSSSAMGRIATNYATTGSKPPSITSQKPPVKKTTMRTSTPSLSTSSYHVAATGSQDTPPSTNVF
ncbi:DNA-binding family protein [Tasmannia lanceolata]|uniref:DNA-binding family protein n=1 Tax=Tasmannia lanceolata TaxID=3420 RepID=UPI00406413AC